MPGRLRWSLSSAESGLILHDGARLSAKGRWSGSVGTEGWGCHTGEPQRKKAEIPIPSDAILPLPVQERGCAHQKVELGFLGPLARLRHPSPLGAYLALDERRFQTQGPGEVMASHLRPRCLLPASVSLSSSLLQQRNLGGCESSKAYLI